MDILPAIDLRNGKVVRLQQGDYDRQTTYSDDPASVARSFVEAGARWIHVVDLDAAKTGVPTNTGAVLAVRDAADAHVQLGGGIRTEQSIEMLLGEGISRLVIGSAALENWAWFERLMGRSDLAGRIALGLDARGGRLAVHGWRDHVDASPLEIADRVKGWPLGAIVYTDIGRDGMLSGPNLDATEALVRASDIDVIASGGVAGLDDILDCMRIGCAGAIAGRSIYEGTIDLALAFRRMNE